ncbi:hypothetical protein PENANT_c001G11839 [Penicillium antarcticum]|uniref:DUF202 domain-containing protein n=1 Tax=Penicillium antarcticum TaxID=416450 RepID=A0A1V6QMV5_9EURO|nr:uncharacterized protein N7508_010171 [Penicillium antarcticum]KAJ5295350.1 hypothetical protein N7508_010171 [Penicillium antarcticum]OQD90570.1 hypothetical protein PENANT_c001G11839 [Penicillium antarcticum]
MNRHIFRRLMPKSVANDGSQLRDHQANERTFLSWNRMGLAFAAMSLALARLDIIDNIFNRNSREEAINVPKSLTQAVSPAKPSNEAHCTATEKGPLVLIGNTSDRVASRVCQAISMWSFGYSFVRYVTTRQNLLKGRFVPAIWGPLFITCGSLGVFGITLKLE